MTLGGRKLPVVWFIQFWKAQKANNYNWSEFRVTQLHFLKIELRHTKPTGGFSISVEQSHFVICHKWVNCLESSSWFAGNKRLLFQLCKRTSSCTPYHLNAAHSSHRNQLSLSAFEIREKETNKADKNASVRRSKLVYDEKTKKPFRKTNHEGVAFVSLKSFVYNKNKKLSVSGVINYLSAFVVKLTNIT